MKNKDDKNKHEDFNDDGMEYEDSTKYGEMIPTFFAWNTLDQQKRRAEKLENITKSNDLEHEEY